MSDPQTDLTRTAVREQGRDGQPTTFYDRVYKAMAERRERAISGRIGIDGETIPWQLNRQGEIGYYLQENVEDTALTDWRVFIHRIRTHSGAHVHQGGIVLYIVKGSGYTVIDGVRHDWEPGDLVCLPIVPGGCEHQHFSTEQDGEYSEFLAFIHVPFLFATGTLFEQKKDSPHWKGQ